MSRDSLDELRRGIERIDTAILRLLNERAEVCVRIGKLKAQDGLSIYDPGREESIYGYLEQQNQGPLKMFEIRGIFSKIISVSRDLQCDGAGSVSGTNTGTPGANTSIYGILGNPVAQSMSPVMHNASFRLLGVDAVYLPFEVHDLPGAVAGIRALKIKGASVTHPFKTEIIGLIDDIDPTAKEIGAVNTLVLDNGRIRGTNTDWTGAVRCLETVLPVEGRKFVVLGAGGAARAVIFGIRSKGGSAVVVNRSEENGLALANEFGCDFVPLSEIENVTGDCLVNATPVGMHPREDEMPVARHVLGQFKAVVDVVYNPYKTKLLREAQSAGCRVASGVEMFLFQGAEQFRIWTGKEPPLPLMREVVMERLGIA